MRITVTTHNIDFNRSMKHQEDDIDNDTETAHVLMLQEARDTVLHRVLDKGWISNQRTANAGKRGTAVAWREHVFRKRYWGLKLGVDNHGVKMHPRWISWVNLRNRQTKQTVKYISVHMPPKRFKFLQPIMVNSLIILMKRSKVPVVVGGDFNFLILNDKYNIARRTNTVIRGSGIDGFYISKSLRPGELHIGDKGYSDHRPMSVYIYV